MSPKSPTPTIYLNNAASAWPKAPGVVAAVAASLELPPVHPGRGSCQADVVAECRQRLARLLGAAAPERVVFTPGATQALNLAILGLGLKRGEHVITSVTEHNSVLRPLAHLADRVGIRVTEIGLDEQGDLDADGFGLALLESPRLVVLNHASNVTGRVNAVGPLFRQAKAAGAVTLLDASQSLGHWPLNPNSEVRGARPPRALLDAPSRPASPAAGVFREGAENSTRGGRAPLSAAEFGLNAPELAADMVAFTGHKGLRGPAGTGGLYVAAPLELEPVLVGGTGVRGDSRRQPGDMPMRLEAGSPNVPALAGLNAALCWLEAEGQAFAERAARLTEALRQGLREIPRVRLFDDTPAAGRLGVVSFRVDGWEVEETGYVLEQSFGIACRAGLHCAPRIHAAIGSAPAGTVRFSPSGATTEDEIAQALAAVRRLAA